MMMCNRPEPDSTCTKVVMYRPNGPGCPPLCGACADKPEAVAPVA